MKSISYPIFALVCRVPNSDVPTGEHNTTVDDKRPPSTTMSHTKKSIEAASNTEGKDPVKAFVHNENLTFKSCHRFAGRGL